MFFVGQSMDISPRAQTALRGVVALHYQHYHHKCVDNEVKTTPRNAV